MNGTRTRRCNSGERAVWAPVPSEPRLGGCPPADGDDIFQLGYLNSLFAMQLARFVQREFSLELGPEDLNFDNFRTVDGIVRLGEAKSDWLAGCGRTAAGDGGQARPPERLRPARLGRPDPAPDALRAVRHPRRRRDGVRKVNLVVEQRRAAVTPVERAPRCPPPAIRSWPRRSNSCWTSV
ncbi:acyl carrier protein [Streptomyces sp. 150FB]|uniref:acyl carrier protein n=1 Tax=Streptomyces sp. 150FB TaxID=1576605 RepID=UPI0022A941E9|nr:acyl carrier protein [Streptomyces sp. 150FB]